ncbi:MAG: geranylgeranyl pyrophosphate synthetase [Phycisphaerae bacterium]|nr:MAG: geranylgeranyl pyrophosphate synthetase [Phycisphaerae bacterium]
MASPDAILDPLPIIEARLAELCGGDADTPRVLAEAMRYAVLNGGKRLRPLLCWHAAEAVGPPFDRLDAADQESRLRACIALELVHAFSLVHDDLPALDNDDLRRGQPTLHKHAGEAAAILAGDALLTYAFRVLDGMTPRPRALATSILADASWRMVRGQVLDTLGGFPERDPPAQRVRTVHEQKTGALIAAACLLGGVCGAARSPGEDLDAHVTALGRFGEHVGLMFQIVDDLLDEEQSAEHLGKRAGKDARAGKLTYPAVHGIAASRAEVERLRVEARRAIDPLGVKAENLRLFADLLASRTK